MKIKLKIKTKSKIEIKLKKNWKQNKKTHHQPKLPLKNLKNKK